ncbi:MAG: hypothetical protein Q9225_001503 [Loekoesia sp. 1 TL-2023]
MNTPKAAIMTSSVLESINPITSLSYSLDEFEQALQGFQFTDDEDKERTFSAYQGTSKNSLESFLQLLGEPVKVRKQGVLRLVGLFNLLKPSECQPEASRPNVIPSKLFGLLKATLIAGHTLCGGDSTIVISKLDYLSRRTSAIREDEIDIVPERVVQGLLAQLVSGVIENCNRVLKLRSPAEVQAYEPAVNQIDQACSSLEKEYEKARKAVSQKKQADEEKIRNVQVWIEKMIGNMPDNHDRYASEHVERTGTTFVRRVQEWLEAKEVPTFLAYGPPGVGKTYLACAVISRHSEEPLKGIDGLAYIYFSYNDLDRQTPLIVYAGIVLQLLTISSHLRDDIFQLFDKHKDSATKRKPQILKGLKRAVTSLKSSMLLVFDALDEASEDTRDEILDLLEGAHIDSARILVTSRNDYGDSPGHGQVVRHPVCADTDDMRVFLEKRLDNRKFKRIVKDQFGLGTKAQKFMSDIKEEVVGTSLGLFLHTEYAVQDICAQVDIKGIKNAASKQHLNANKIYAETLERIKSLAEPEKQLAYRIIAWLTLTKKPFQEDELSEAFAISNEDGRVTPDSKLVIENAVEYCRGLVIRVKMTKASYLQLAHSTVREYFLQFEAFQHYHIDMCLTCFNRVISCLTSDTTADQKQDGPDGKQGGIDVEFGGLDDILDKYSMDSSASETSGESDTTGSGAGVGGEDGEDSGYGEYDNDEIDELFFKDTDSQAIFEDNQSWRLSKDVWPRSLLPWVAKKTPFSLYAARYALSHLQEATVNSEIERIVLNFVQIAISRKRKSIISSKSQDHPYSMKMLHMASFIGIPSIVEKVLEMPMIHVDDKDILGRTALMWALGLGRESVANSLLDAGAQLEDYDRLQRSTLMYATTIRNEAILVKLLQKTPKKDVNASFLAACAKANNVFLLDKALFNAIIDINSVDENGRAPIHEAAINGSEAAVESLVRHRAEISAPDSSGRTPLMHACGRQNIDIVEILIKAGANPDSPSQKSESPLHIAAKNAKGRLKMLRILLRANANILAEDDKGLLPLQSFLRSCKNHGRSEKETLAGVELLSANPDTLAHQSHDGANALHEAVQCPHVSVLKELVRRAPSRAINFQRKSGETPIFLATDGGNVPAFEFLIDLPGINLLATRNDKKTLLNCAARANEITVARKLMDKEPRLIELAEEHSTPATHYAIEKHNAEMFESLLEAGSDPRSRKHNRDLISHAASIGQMWCLDTLLDLKAWLTYDQSGRCIAHRNYHSKTLLHEATIGPSLSLLEKIVSALPLEGLSLEDCDTWGQTPLHYAAKDGKEAFVSLLLTSGSEKDATTATGQTALDLALESESSDTVRTLVLADAHLGKGARSRPWRMQYYEKEDFYPMLNDIISAPIIQQENDMATANGQLYKEKTVHRVGTDGDVFDEWSPDIPYLETTIPQNAALPISQVIFETVSHDQGWSDVQLLWKGTYHHSYSFFLAAVQPIWDKTGDPKERQPWRIPVQDNRHADFKFRTHVNIIDSTEPNQQHERKEWVRTLRPGDRIQLFAKAKYRAWKNYVQSARITIRYHEFVAEEGKGNDLEEISEKLRNPRMLEQTPGEASPSHQPRVIIYHQSLRAENGILTSLRPLVLERTGVTAVILGTFHLRKKLREIDAEAGEIEMNSGTIIYLNDFAIDDPSLDELWVDIEYLHREGVKIIGMLRICGDDEMSASESNWLGGSDDTAFEQSYKTLHNLVVSKSLDGFEFDLESDMPQIFTNTGEDLVSLGGLTRLIDKLRGDFRSNFTIAVTTSAEALLGTNGNKKRSSIDYRTLERQNGQHIDWYNVRIFSNNGRSDDQNNEDHFSRTFKKWRVENGTDESPEDLVSRLVSELDSYVRLLQENIFPADKLLITLLTAPNAVSEASRDYGVYIKSDVLSSLLKLIRWSYGPLKFGGVAGWKYLPPWELRTAEPAGRFASTWAWVRETREILENVFEYETV